MKAEQMIIYHPPVESYSPDKMLDKRPVKIPSGLGVFTMLKRQKINYKPLGGYLGCSMYPGTFIGIDDWLDSHQKIDPCLVAKIHELKGILDVEGLILTVTNPPCKRHDQRLE